MMSPICATGDHDRCDGTAWGNARTDVGFMRAAEARGEDLECECACHGLST